MSTTTPNAPLLDPTKSRNKSTLHVAGFIVVAHLAVFVGLLLIGCRKENHADSNGAGSGPGAGDTALSGLPGSALPGSGAIDTNPPAVTNLTVPTPTNALTYATPTNPLPGGLQPANPGGSLPGATDTSTPPPQDTSAAGAQAYKVKKGDIAYNIAKSHGVTLKALKEANPGVDLAKLKVGQEVQVPAASAKPAKAGAASDGNSAAAPDASASGDGTDYTVKGGDTLSRIARHYHTTVKAIRHANNLSSDNIKQGQKLKIPAKAAAEAGAQPASPAEVTPTATPAPPITPSANPTAPGRQ
jgi:LysM repeat protein